MTVRGWRVWIPSNLVRSVSCSPVYWGVLQSSASTIIWIDESSSAAASTASSNRPAGCGRVNTSTPRPATSNCLFIGAPDSITGLVYHLCANPSSSVTKWSLLARSRTTVDKWCRFIKEPAAIHTSLPLNCVTDIPSTVYWQIFLVNGPLKRPWSWLTIGMEEICNVKYLKWYLILG